MHRSRRIKGDSDLFPLRAITAPGPAGELVRSGRKHPASSSLGSVSVALHASEPQLPAVISEIPCNETAIIQTTFFFFCFTLYLLHIGRRKEENPREKHSPSDCKFSCVCRTGGEEAMAVPVKAALSLLVLTVTSE